MKRYKYVPVVVEIDFDDIEDGVNYNPYVQEGYRVVSISYMWNTTVNSAKFLITLEKPETDG